MGKAIKVIQGGVTTILPNNPATITRLQHFNQINSKHRNADDLYYNIYTDVDPEEEATIFPAMARKAKVQGPSIEQRLRDMEAKNQELQNQLLTFLLNQGAKAPVEPPAEESIQSRGPGRPPKNA